MGSDNLLIAALAVMLGGLLVAAGIEDARTREIANAKNAAIALLAPLWWWAMGLGWAGVGVQLLVAAIVFAVFVGAFACGWMGGGDVKMIAALALWLPLGSLLDMLMLMSVLGGAITLVMVIERRWQRRIGAVEVPYGVAIAAAALLALPATLPGI
ncbi:A24 family peptidase [Sphingomonas melonis]|jgi:prepilin peptidase CpaA|uniref:Prepilin peptidase CpaA n=1 Tax=Sphingomonas melonis TaxID=152682 RepID=A0A7Y9FM99_9SPHN|nr:prepilin peptidase [Sphingomonas melonis]NYD89622.1 prepilin peptidase CpaA [Sphingomonas melonis]